MASPLAGNLLVVAPHMDDETLGCGMLLSEHSGKTAVNVLFATDGARSPEPASGPVHDLPSIRAAEAVAALGALGIDREQITFLGFPDGALTQHESALRRELAESVQTLRPDYVLVPFRYDRHPDHLAVNRAATRAQCTGALGNTQVVEYFVYTQWRLLRTGDVRNYLSPGDVVQFDSRQAATCKRAALALYRSQTTRYFAWQQRPILTDALIERVCTEPEIFLLHRMDRNGRLGLARGRNWVPIACRLEPRLKHWKDRLIARLAR